MTSSTVATSRSRTDRRIGRPALFTTASRAPSASHASTAMPAAASGSARSTDHRRWPRPGPTASHRASTSSSRSARRATRPTVAPRSASVVARASPMPDDAPVTSTRAPARSTSALTANPRPGTAAGRARPSADLPLADPTGACLDQTIHSPSDVGVRNVGRRGTGSTDGSGGDGRDRHRHDVGEGARGRRRRSGGGPQPRRPPAPGDPCRRAGPRRRCGLAARGARGARGLTDTGGSNPTASQEPLDIRGVDVAAMVPSLCAVDGDGRPISPGLLYGDERGGAAVDAATGSSLELVHFLEWLVAEHPDAAGFWPAQAVANAALGGVGAIDTMVAYLAMPLFDLRGWDADVAAGAGLDDIGRLPVILGGNETAGAVASAGGAVLGGGTIDALGEQLVAGATELGDVLVILGSTLIVWAVVPEWREVAGLWTVPHTAPGKVLIGGPSNAGGLFLDWVGRALGRDRSQPVLPAGEPVPVDPSGFRCGSPTCGANGCRSTTPTGGRRCTTSTSASVPRPSSGPPVRRRPSRCATSSTSPACRRRRIVATGGGVRDAVWVQALADGTGLPVDVVAVPEGGALGAAWLARQAAGLERPGADASALGPDRPSGRARPRVGGGRRPRATPGIGSWRDEWAAGGRRDGLGRRWVVESATMGGGSDGDRAGRGPRGAGVDGRALGGGPGRARRGAGHARTRRPTSCRRSGPSWPSSAGWASPSPPERGGQGYGAAELVVVLEVAGSVLRTRARSWPRSSRPRPSIGGARTRSWRGRSSTGPRSAGSRRRPTWRSMVAVTVLVAASARCRARRSRGAGRWPTGSCCPSPTSGGASSTATTSRCASCRASTPPAAWPRCASTACAVPADRWLTVARRAARPTPPIRSAWPSCWPAPMAVGVADWCVDDRRRVRPGARAVRPAHRAVPGGEAPLRQHARRPRGGPGRGVGRGPRVRRSRRAAAWRSRRARPRRWPPRPGSGAPRTASRCSAASATRGSTTPTST